MKAQYLGHVVFYVKDLQRSLAFYRDLLGFKEVGRIFHGQAAALTSGRTHHELLLIQVGDAPEPLQGRRRGLYHIGIKVGDSLDELRQAKRELEDALAKLPSSQKPALVMLFDKDLPRTATRKVRRGEVRAEIERRERSEEAERPTGKVDGAASLVRSTIATIEVK